MLGAHSAKSQKRKILAIVAAVIALILVAVLVWPSGSQSPPRQPRTPARAAQHPGAPIPASATTTVPTQCRDYCEPTKNAAR